MSALAYVWTLDAKPGGSLAIIGKLIEPRRPMKTDPARPRHANCSRARDNSNVRPLPLELSRTFQASNRRPVAAWGRFVY